MHAHEAGRTNQNDSTALSVFAVFVVVLLPWMFVGGPDYYSARSFQLFWQLGHPVLFIAVGGLIAVSQGRLAGRNLRWVVGCAVTCALVVGGAIEVLQGLTGRDASFADLRLDVMGALLGATFLARGATPAGEWIRRAIAVSVALALLVVDVWPLARALVDERDAREHFPVLADFSAPFEQDRWIVNGSRHIQPIAGATNAREMQIELRPGRYSGFGLSWFPGDWRGYTALVLTLSSEDASDLQLTCRIHDRAHDTNNRFDDRFNRRFPLVSGIQEIRIGLDEVENAPAARKLNLGEVAGFGCFFVSLERPRVLRIRRLELKREPANVPGRR